MNKTRKRFAGNKNALCMKIDCSKHEHELLRAKKNVRRTANENISGANQSLHAIKLQSGPSDQGEGRRGWEGDL